MNTQCQCITIKGNQCKLPASTKKEDNPKFCSRWHQKCQNIVKSKPKSNTKNNYIFFWKPDQENGYLGQWFEASFEEERDGEIYKFPTAEHYMMWRKALLFDDEEMAEKILNTKSPKRVKALGRKVRNFDEEEWMENNYNIVVDGNMLKFKQNPELLDKLLATGDKILAEASPYDKVWGIGLKKESPLALDVKKWKGKNLLGKALMEVRERLKLVL